MSSAGTNPRRLFIHNVSFKVDERQVEDVFSRHGKVLNIQIPKDPQGRSKG